MSENTRGALPSPPIPARLHILLVALLVLTSGCSDNNRSPSTIAASPPAQADEDTRDRLKQIEEDLLAAQKQLNEEQEISKELRRRVSTIELRFETPPSAELSLPGPKPAPPSRPAYSAASLIPASAPASTESPTSGPLTRDPDIIRHCAEKWQSNFQMVAYCQKGQQQAKDTWLRGNNVHNTNGSAFATIRRECTSKWGTNYEMRVYCEREQVKAYATINGR